MIQERVYSGKWASVEYDWYLRRYELKIRTGSCYPEGCFDEDFDGDSAEALRQEVAEAISALETANASPPIPSMPHLAG